MKRGAQSLRTKMRNAELNLELRSYNYLRLVAACSKIARTRKTKLLSLVLLRAQKRI